MGFFQIDGALVCLQRAKGFWNRIRPLRSFKLSTKKGLTSSVLFLLFQRFTITAFEDHRCGNNFSNLFGCF